MPPDTSPDRVPQIGDIVRYYHADSGLLLELAAMVTRVERPDDPKSAVILTVFQPGRTPEPHQYAIPYSEKPLSGYWSWRPDR